MRRGKPVDLGLPRCRPRWQWRRWRGGDAHLHLHLHPHLHLYLLLLPLLPVLQCGAGSNQEGGAGGEKYWMK
tara:strand:- start:200 stop:415 length:216 start_codon:yes stop_codon:yes gene_type:complete